MIFDPVTLPLSVKLASFLLIRHDVFHLVSLGFDALGWRVFDAF
jgi:hypothetical protein